MSVFWSIRNIRLPIVGFLLLSVFLSSAITSSIAHAEENANRSGTDLNYHSQIYYRQSQAPDGDTERWGGSNSTHTYFMENEGIGECDTVIVIEGPVDKATEGYVLDRWRQNDIGVGACRVKSSERITINNGLSKDMSKRKSNYEKQKKNLEDNAYSICNNSDKQDIPKCEEEVKKAFEECFQKLGGGADKAKFNKDVSPKDLRKCISEKTGIPPEVIGESVEIPTDSQTNPQCNVKGMGWLICQASRLMAKITDGAFAALKELLEVPGLGRNTPGGQAMYDVWSGFRNVANVVFVIVFLYVIYSQLTGVGLDNYGLKKLLPRLIIAVILTNISFFICAVMVDITNVLGSSLKDVLSSIALPVKPNFNSWNQVASAALILTGAVALYLSITALLPVVTSGLIAILMTIILLVARQALIVMLIILSPVAFVLNVLPNTQKWFERWWSAFFMILMMYPVIAVVYGGSRIAAGVISTVNPDQKTMILFAILALGVQTIPLFTVPLLMKAGGGVFERFSGIINNPSKGVFDRVRKKSQDKADEYSKKRDINALTKNGTGGKGLHARLAKRRAKRDFAADYAKNQIKGDALKAYTGSSGVASDIAEAGAAGTVSMSDRLPFRDGHEAAMEKKQDTVDEIKSQLEQTSFLVEVGDIKSEQAVFKDENYSNADLERVFKEGKNKDGSLSSEAARAAAAQQLAREGNLDRIHDILRSLKEMEGNNPSRMMREAVASGIDNNSKAKKGAAHLRSTSNSAAIRNGSAFQGSGDVVDNLYARAAASDTYNSNSVATETSQSLRGLRVAMEHNAISGEQADAVRDAIGSAQSSERLKTKMSNEARREASKF